MDPPNIVEHHALAEVEAQAQLPLLPLDQVALQLETSTARIQDKLKMFKPGASSVKCLNS